MVQLQQLANQLWWYLFSVGYGDIRIGEGDYGELMFEDRDDNWKAVCNNGFDDNAGDVACKQLGFKRSTGVYVYSEYVILTIAMQ